MIHIDTETMPHGVADTFWEEWRLFFFPVWLDYDRESESDGPTIGGMVVAHGDPLAVMTGYRSRDSLYQWPDGRLAWTCEDGGGVEVTTGPVTDVPGYLETMTGWLRSRGATVGELPS